MPFYFCGKIKQCLSTLQISLLGTLENWKRLHLLNVSGNRWNCDCTLLSYFPEVLKAMEANTLTRALCSEPKRLHNSVIAEFIVMAFSPFSPFSCFVYTHFLMFVEPKPWCHCPLSGTDAKFSQIIGII